MVAQKNHYYSYGEDWRQVMAESKFSLCPRGYGRTSYHIMEALQMGLIPIHVYLDQPWIPYGDFLGNITYSVQLDQLPGLIAKLEKLTNSEIASMEQRIMELREDYFTFEGVMKQIGKFMMNPEGSELQCQPITF